MHRELPLYFTQVLGEQAWVGSKYTRIRDLTLENAKLLVKLLSPETANIKNIFHQKTLLYTNVVRDRNNVVSNNGCNNVPGGVGSSLCVLIPSVLPATLFPLLQVPFT